MNDTLTKHEQILQYIESLKSGTKISVRGIAKDMDVSEGTAYRAIKEAEKQGLVATKQRIGTVRIEKRNRQVDKLTFAELVHIVEGQVLGGENGLDKTLTKFVIGAMEIDAMMRYIDAGSLLIVGNRHEAHICALKQGSAVLITGGFDTSEEVKKLASELGLPIMTCSYDTFTVASMINRAIYDRLIKRKILLVEDLIFDKERPIVLKSTTSVAEWQQLFEETGITRFPVVDEWNRVTGMVTSKDVLQAEPNQNIDKWMTRHPITVTPQTTVASAAHMMVWEGIELLPVVDENRKLVGSISRQDVLKAMQYHQHQPQSGETFDDLIWMSFDEHWDEAGALYFSGRVTPQMTGALGTLSEGVLTTLITKSAARAIKELRKGNMVLENMTTYFVRPLQIDNEVIIRPRMIELSRKFGKIDVELYYDEQLVCKAMLTAQMIDEA